MLLEDDIKEYVYEIQIRNYTSRTIKGYKNNVLRFSQFIKNQLEVTELEEVSPAHIKQYLNSLKEKGRSPVYINTILKNLRTFFQYCYEEGYSMNIAKKVIWLKEKRIVILTFTDI